MTYILTYIRTYIYACTVYHWSSPLFNKWGHYKQLLLFPISAHSCLQAKLRDENDTTKTPKTNVQGLYTKLYPVIYIYLKHEGVVGGWPSKTQAARAYWLRTTTWRVRAMTTNYESSNYKTLYERQVRIIRFCMRFRIRGLCMTVQITRLCMRIWIERLYI